jgi:hypothetical protein
MFNRVGWQVVGGVPGGAAAGGLESGHPGADALHLCQGTGPGKRGWSSRTYLCEGTGLVRGPGNGVWLRALAYLCKGTGMALSCYGKGGTRDWDLARGCSFFDPMGC